MIQIQNIYDSIKRVGNPYFSDDLISKMVNKIDKHTINPVAHYTCLTQENNSVRLESSILTQNTIYDFTYKENDLFITIIMLKTILLINSQFSNDEKMSLKLIYGVGGFIEYKAYNKRDVEILFDYEVALHRVMKEINQF